MKIYSENSKCPKLNNVELPEPKDEIRLIASSTIPENEVWVIDAKNRITRIVNIKEKGR